jgi:phosphatidylserine/phosphatidylglycerophosphate/cardiolipin synthase-like enzyme
MNLYNEKTFYPALLKDMYNAKNEVIIYSPFISKYRADFFREPLRKLKRRNINVFIFTRPIEEHEGYIQDEVKSALEGYKKMGTHIIYLDGTIHEKVAVIDRKVLWEGSMNILSQRSSKEIMARITDDNFIAQIIRNLNLDGKILMKSKVKGSSHCVKLGTRRRIQIFTFELVIPALRLLFSIVSHAIVLLLKGFLLVLDLVSAILR